MAGTGPLPNPRRRRRNADPVTGARRVACVECGSPTTEGAACAYCGASPAMVDTDRGGVEARASGPRIAALSTCWNGIPP